MDPLKISAAMAVVNMVLLASVLVLAYIRTSGLEKSRKLQEAVTVFKELQLPELVDVRKYIYDEIPQNVEGIDKEQPKAHVRKAESVFLALDRVGYLVYRGHIDKDTFIERHWYMAWRVWKKSNNLIAWAREQRGEPKYYNELEYLFYLSEAYRIQKGYQEPKFY